MDAIDAGALPVTESQLAEAADVHAEALAVCMNSDRVLLEVAHELETAGVGFRVLKGVACATVDYAEPSLRCYGDLDVLIESSGYSETIAALLRAGYVRAWPELRAGFERRFGKGVVLVRDGFELDVHRTLVSGYFGLAIDLEDLFGRPATFEVAGVALPCLSAEQRFIHACYHAALARRPRLVPLRDVGQMLTSGHLDEADVVDCAYRWRGQSVVARGVRLAVETLGLPEFSGIAMWARHFRASKRDRRAISAYAGPRPAEAGRAVSALRIIPGVTGKAEFLRAMLVPDESYLGWAGQRRLSWLRRAKRALARGTEDLP
jgi:hypothetical protein